MSLLLEALEYYRRLVSLIYREVGSMKAGNHNLYTKSNFAQIPSIQIKEAANATDSELTDDDIIVRYSGEEVVELTFLHASQR